MLLDLGCGKGRVLLIASIFQFQEARGIEFARELCNIARNNCAIFKKANGTRTTFTVIESDVVDYIIRPEENVFFFYNSFDKKILNRVLANIADSLKRAPRKVLFICYNPHLSHVIDQQGGFVRMMDFRLYEYRFLVYSNGASRERKQLWPVSHPSDAEQ